MKQYRIVYRAPGTEKWLNNVDDEIYTNLRDAKTAIKMMEEHYKQYPGDYFEEKIQSREVSDWEDETV